MLGFLIFCDVWFLLTVLICCSQNSTAVMRFSVPEDHHVLLRCGSSDTTDVVWTHRRRRIPVTEPNNETNDDPTRYFILSDGSLQVLQLDDSDSGEYHCNQQLVAELQVLAGHEFMVSAGRTLLLPCSSSFKPRERWYHRRKGEKREVIFTIFKNGTLKPERETGRLSYEYDALQIKDLQPEDAGQYQCNTNLWTTVTVLSVQPEPTSIQGTSRTTATPAVMTEVVGTKKKEKRKKVENVLLLVAVVGLGLMILLMAVVCVLLISMKCRRRKKKYGGAADAPFFSRNSLVFRGNTPIERHSDSQRTMPDTRLYLEALSALSGCNVEPSSASLLTTQDFVNIVTLKQFYKQEGFKEIEYPSLGTLSLQDLENQDMYSSPSALVEGPSTSGPPENLRTKVKINPKSFFDHQFDYNFTKIKDLNKTFLRGGEQYIRPCGWNRVALQVTQKYDDGDSWLGMGKDAWPVSYNTHSMDGSLGIILTHSGSSSEENGFLDAAAASLVSGETNGRGVYSTSDINIAEKYCKKFKSKVDGKTYKVILQNRINPEKRMKCQREDICLVYVPAGTNDIQVRAILQQSIRPYGLLLKQE